jgi:ubiquinone/menaquinone biosynthesis C-methylase UbiE
MIRLKSTTINDHTTSRAILSDDKKTLYSSNELIMMEFERPMMVAAAKTIGEKGGDVMNVGFGMGIIDTEIQKYNPLSHTIIEIHPDIQKRMLSENWDLISNVNLMFGNWRDFVDELPLMDAIYFDTLDDQEFIDFISIAWKLLKPNGIFSYYNNPMDKDNTELLKENYKDIIHEYYDVEIETILIPTADETEQLKHGNYTYWNEDRKKYFHPILRPKQKYRNI